jgi:dipeptidyl aminopeptidase/acylaminoacyl peptidase
MRISLAGLALALLAAPCPGQAAKSGFPDNEQMRHFRAMANPRLSPDGRHVLVQITDATADGAKSHLWLIDVDANTYRQLTYSPDSDKGGERSGEWMPDGQSILFIAKRGEHTALYQLPMGGGEAKPFDLKVTPVVDVSKAPDALPPAKDAVKKEDKVEPIAVDVGGYRVAPDGKSIALLINDPETPGEKKQKDAKADAAWVDHDPHGERLYVLDVANGKLTPAGVPPDVRGAAWCPDSTRLAALAEGQNDAGDLGPAGSVWMVAANDIAHPAKLTEMPATTEAMTWSADGKSLIFDAQAKQEAPPGYGDLYEYAIGAKATKILTDGFSGSIGRAEPIALKGGGFVAMTEQGFGMAPAKFAKDAQAMQVMKTPVPTVSAISTNAAQNGWVFIGNGAGHATELYFSAALDATPRLLKTPPLVPDGITPVAPKHLEWKSDSFTIQGVLYLPPEAATKKVPLIVEVHGGPLGAYHDGYAPFTLWLLGHGWAVLDTNPRGSTGRGAVFAAANKNDLGGGDYRDIMAGVEFVEKTEPVDSALMGLMGYSYGGEMAGFVEGKTAVFKAIVSGAPVIDQQSEYGTERGSWYDRWYFGKPWEHEADAWRQSPLSGVGQARTPFLLLQGESDSTDPLGQSQEMYRALRQMGVAVDLVTYPRDDHGPLGSAIYGAPTREPWHGFDARQRVEKFFEKAFR